jgi:hypothetical protein
MNEITTHEKHAAVVATGVVDAGKKYPLPSMLGQPFIVSKIVTIFTFFTFTFTFLIILILKFNIKP